MTHQPEQADILDRVLSAKEAARMVPKMSYVEFLTLVKNDVLPHRQIGTMYLLNRETVEQFIAKRAARREGR